MALCTLTLPCYAVENTVVNIWRQNPRTWTPIVSKSNHLVKISTDNVLLSICKGMYYKICVYSPNTLHNGVAAPSQQFYTQVKTTKSTCFNILTTLRAISHLNGKFHLNQFTTWLHMYVQYIYVLYLLFVSTKCVMHVFNWNIGFCMVAVKFKKLTEHVCMFVYM